MLSENHKEKLLATAMNMFGLPKPVNDWFFRPDIMKQSEVLSLQQFFSSNSTFLMAKEKVQTFLSPEHEWPTFLTPNHFAFKRIKRYLLQAGFDGNDWIQLLPRKSKRARFPDFSFLKNEDLMKSSILTVTEIRSNPNWKKIISNLLDMRNIEYNKDNPDMNVESMLLTNAREVNALLVNAERRYMQRRLRLIFISIQNRLKSYGLAEEAGIFMKLQIANNRKQKD